MRLQTRIYLLCGSALALGGCAAIYLMVALAHAGVAYSSLLHNQVQEADCARLMQVTFKKQVQAWKDVLLRGQNPDDLTKYSEEFRQDADKVSAMATKLEAQVVDLETRTDLQEFITTNKTLGVKYDAALEAFVQAKGLNAQAVEKMVKGQDRHATDLVDKIVADLVNNTTVLAAAQERHLSSQLWIVSILLLAAFFGTAAASTITIRRMTDTLSRAAASLSEEANQIASAASQVSASSQSLAQGSS